MTDIKAELDAIKADMEKDKIMYGERIAKLESRLAAEPEGKWTPERGYWATWIALQGTKAKFVKWTNSTENHQSRTLGLCFPTQKACESHFQNLETIKALADAADFEPDWKDEDQEKWVPVYNHAEDHFIWWAYTYTNVGAPVYFRTQAEGQAAVAAIGVDKIKALFTGGGL